MRSKRLNKVGGSCVGVYEMYKCMMCILLICIND